MKMKFEKIVGSDGETSPQNALKFKDISTRELLYVLLKRSKMFLLSILGILVILSIGIIVYKHINYVPPPPPPPDEMLDENGVIQAEGNGFPSKYQSEAQIIRRIFFDEIANSTVEITNPLNKMLIGISSAVADIQRRHLFRTHQISPYSKYKELTWKFFLFEPSPNYRQLIKYENDTFGDIIVIEGIQDGRKIARELKPFEIFTYVENHMGVYKYVAKMDTDILLNVPDFVNEYFNETVQNMDYTIIAPVCWGRFLWPMGAFEAVSWKLVRILNKLYKYVKRTSYAEDLQIGWYLYDAGIPWEFVQLEEDRAYDFRGPNFGPNDVAYNSIRVHELKDENIFLLIAGCFSEEGMNRTYIDEMRKVNWLLEEEPK